MSPLKILIWHDWILIGLVWLVDQSIKLEKSHRTRCHIMLNAARRSSFQLPQYCGASILTGDADSSLATLGGTQVAPGHTETPVVLWAVEILHLLPGHVNHHLTHLQPWDDRENKQNSQKLDTTNLLDVQQTVKRQVLGWVWAFVNSAALVLVCLVGN